MCFAFHGWKKEPLKIPTEPCRWLSPPTCLPRAPQHHSMARRWLVEQQGHGKTSSKGHQHHPSPSMPQAKGTVLSLQRCIFGFSLK